MINTERIVNEFLTLCKIPSESKEELEVAIYLRNILEEIGCSVYIDDTKEKTGSNTGNIIAKLEGANKNAVKIFFSSHMDTVKPGKNICPIIDNQIIRSSGDTILGGDDKGGIAAILEALRVVKEQKIKHGDIFIVFTVCEEIGLLGAKSIDFSNIPVDFGYVLDSDGSPGVIIIKGPAQDQIKIEVHGKAAHAGLCPEEGINAIAVASRAIAKMKLGRIDVETTANIGMISGGKASNIVPEYTKMEGEARSLNIDKLNKITNDIISITKEVAGKYNAKLEVEVERAYSSISLDENELVVKIASKATETLGLKKIIKSTGGGSDANIFNGCGLPTANLGIGMSKVHTTEEFMEQKDLIDSARLLIEIIKEAQHYSIK